MGRPKECSACGAELRLRPHRCPLCGAATSDGSHPAPATKVEDYQAGLRDLRRELKRLRDEAEAV